MRKAIFVAVTYVFFISCNNGNKTMLRPATSSSSDSVDAVVVDKRNQSSEKLTTQQQSGTLSHNGASYKTYIIKKGNNYSDGNAVSLGSRSFLRFKAILDSSCIYQTVLPANQEDINKLFGFSDCMSHHHTNSARFGWNWDNGALRIHAYCYADGKRAYKEIGTVKVNEEFDCSLTLQPKKYIFSLNGKTVEMDRGCDNDKATGYKLYPYFGGNEPAPQDIYIKIKEY